MEDISKLPYAAWLEEAIETVVGVSPKSTSIAATAHDGTTFTGITMLMRKIRLCFRTTSKAM